MTTRRKKPFDLLSVGELLIDFISTEFTEKLGEAAQFQRLLGGSPANLCMNMARLGNTAQMAASVGADAMGDFLVQQLKALKVDCSSVLQIDRPTTLILVTRSQQVSNFQPYRAADYEISEGQLPLRQASDYSLFHTTCFALSQAPAQTTIRKAASVFSKSGGQLSIDLNYAGKIWPQRAQARQIIREYCSYGALVKISEVDWKRLWPDKKASPEYICQFFLGWGANQVCLTLGGDGGYVGFDRQVEYFNSRRIEVKDTTGAGDAFWSGYLTAWLDGYDPLQCALAGRKMAELKLTCFGPLLNQMNRQVIYEDLKARKMK